MGRYTKRELVGTQWMPLMKLWDRDQIFLVLVSYNYVSCINWTSNGHFYAGEGKEHEEKRKNKVFVELGWTIVLKECVPQIRVVHREPWLPCGLWVVIQLRADAIFFGGQNVTHNIFFFGYNIEVYYKCHIQYWSIYKWVLWLGVNFHGHTALWAKGMKLPVFSY